MRPLCLSIVVACFLGLPGPIGLRSAEPDSIVPSVPVDAAAGTDSLDAGTPAPATASTVPPGIDSLELAAPAPPEIIALVPLGGFPRSLAAAVERRLQEELQVEVRRLPARALPRSAYYAPRKRYRAERLLDALDGALAESPGVTRVLGMTGVDISTSREHALDWGMYGLGRLGGPSGVLSAYRLRRGARDAAHLRFRVAATALHEIGHTLGLPHCREPRCVMRDAEGGIRNIDTSTGRFCAPCRARLEAAHPAPIARRSHLPMP